MKLLHRFVTIGGFVLGLLSFVATIGFYKFADAQNPFLYPFRGISNLFGGLSVAVGVAAVSIWILRKLYVEIKKRKIPDFELTRAALLFLRKHHILLGWLTIVTAGAHGIYYMLQYPNQAFRIYTGLVAWILLVILAGLGAFLNYKLRDKQKSKTTRLYHIVFAIFFLAGMVIHTL
ncbi:hypothetical protein LSG31_10095 [Fodinisporobacter ferrooxydans]|uniref:Ferric oxidoreductase domain-containing protein n=1 Tax=Fodinisporobacter ferrooxydans TaxID=2901836 RepID=A0ABY4CPP7_9BACL|nr:hypothetical protein LSG31_10095 [Alicyclobacillaceae bacterium MYW30-H2]